MTLTPVFSLHIVESLAKEIALAVNTAEVFDLLQSRGVKSVEQSKEAHKIKGILMQEQRLIGTGDCVIGFLETTFELQRWAGRQSRFEEFRDKINALLVFAGWEVGKDGKCSQRPAAMTHEDAALITSRRLITELKKRNAHAEVFKYCQAELVAEDCFNAVLEATKGLAERIRKMSNLDLDGHKLVAKALEGKTPVVRLNSLQSDTDRNEQLGIAHLMKGAISAFRNPVGHEPKVLWHVSEADALDLLSTLSLIHRRLDDAVVVATKM